MTSPQDVRDVLARLLHDRGCMAGAECRDSPTTWVTYYNLPDAVLAAASPVIRQQERAKVAEEIARAIWDAPIRRYGVFDREQAAAIARSHSTQPDWRRSWLELR